MSTAAHLPGTLFARNLLERRGLLFQLVRRDFDQRFVGSAMGWIWALIHPTVLLLSWYFVFSVCLKMRLGPRDITSSYPLFLFTGMLPWLLFSDTVQRCSTSLIEQSNLITKTVFPAEIVPISVYLSSLISHLMGLGLVVTAIAVVLNRFSVFLILLPFYMLLLGMFAVGIGWIVASLQVYLRDTAQVLSVILTLWFWTTPIMITEEQYPARMMFLLTDNPLAYFVRSYRQLLLTNSPPGLHDLGVILAWSIGTFVAGGLFFRQLKRGFADVL